MHLTFDIDDAKYEAWRSWVLSSSDLFGRSYAGYWLWGVDKNDAEEEWLAYEMKDEAPPSRELAEKAIEIWRRPLGPRRKLLKEIGFYIIDSGVVVEAFKRGILRKGIDWYERGDGSDCDVAIQLALFGKVRYG